MIDRGASTAMPLVLVGGDPERATRSMERVLEPVRCVVVRAATARRAVQYVRETRPDAIILDEVLPDANGPEACTALRAEPRVGHATPILITALGEPSAEQRRAAYQAGAWDCFGSPPDPEEFVPRLQVYLAARQETDHAHMEGMVDGASGLYNLPGLVRRAREVGSLMFRQHGALACVALAVDLASAPPAEAAGQVFVTCVQALKASARVSDVLGRLGPTELVILAPSTDAQGALKLAERLHRGLQLARNRSSLPPFTLRVGYDAVGNLGYTPVDPMTLVTRATAALREGKSESGFAWIRHFDDDAETRLG